MAQLPAQVKAFGQMLTAETNLKRMRNMLPARSDVTPEQIASVIMSQVRQNPDLVTKTNPDSLMAACYDVAKSGLLPDGILGQAYIVPYRGQAQFIPGYRGLITLAMNSGKISEIWAKEVRMRDHFVVHEGTEHKIEHHVDYTKGLKGRGEIIAVYAVAHFHNGGKAFEIMSAEEVEEIRKAAPSGNSPAWRNHWGEMAKKTALRRLAKWLPQSVQRYTQMEEHFEATGEVSHLSDNMYIEAEPGSYNDVPQEEQAQPEPQQEEQTAQANGTQQPKSNGNGKSKQGSRTAAAVGESKKRGRPKKQQEPEPEPAQEDEPTGQETQAEEAANEPEPTQEAEAQDVDPETGEITEGTVEGAIDENNINADVSAQEIEKGRRGPQVDPWFEAVIDRLNNMTTPDEVNAFWQNSTEQIALLRQMNEETAQEAEQLFKDRLTEVRKPF